MNINATNKGITPNSDITCALSTLLKELSAVTEDKTLLIAPGTYYINSTLCDKEILYITNSCADKEYSKDETPRLCNIAVLIKNIDNLEIIADEVYFVIDGKVTNIVIENCNNITIRGLDIDVINPDLHELKVVKRGLFYVDYELNRESNYIKENGAFYFVGKEFKTAFLDSATTAHWIGYVPPNNQDSLWRVGHPLACSVRIIELASHIFRVYYPVIKTTKIGAKFYLFDVNRKNAGIFVNRSSNINLINVSQHFNYGLAYVAQDCDTLTVDSCKFLPTKDSSMLMASIADFIQLCMCRGDIVIKKCKFIGAGDDTLNVHGVHLKVNKISGNTVDIKFCHHQTMGFNPMRVGDEVDFIDRFTLDIHGKAKIIESQLIDPYTIKLVLDNVKGLDSDMVLENVTSCPNMYFTDNYMARIITRGLLVTTRGKVLIDGNTFENTSMNSILLSNDAKSWYESGRVEDITITNNVFGRCPKYTVQVKPENGTNTVRIHKNITIRNNVINSEKGGFYIKNADNVVIGKNKFTNKKQRLIIINSDVKIED